MLTINYKKKSKQIKIKPNELKSILGSHLLDNIRKIHSFFKGDIFLSGGTVRDLLMNRPFQDIDLTVQSNAKKWARRLCDLLDGTYITLGRDEDTARVVWKNGVIDISSFREKTGTINEDLRKRDITINSMAILINKLFLGISDYSSQSTLQLLDPTGGINDIREKIIRPCSENSFSSDPLRLLRIYRFAATLNFTIDPKANKMVSGQKNLITKIPGERIAHELDLIMTSNNTGNCFSKMAETGLLWEIIPEFQAGCGMKQPSSHHLDVFEHSLLTLCQMEKILADPVKFFPQSHESISSYLSDKETEICLKWAAFFHDLGKPSTYWINEKKGGRITFYNHDKVGADLFRDIGGRLKWSNNRIKKVANLIFHHMRPFHLLNVQRHIKLSLKAGLRFLKTLDNELPGVLLLSMADSMAGQGSNRPKMIEKEISQLFIHMEQLRKKHLIPIRSNPPLLSGKDLIEKLDLVPGPIFKEILSMIEDAQLEKKISTHDQALAMAIGFLKSRQSPICFTKDKRIEQ